MSRSASVFLTVILGTPALFAQGAPQPVTSLVQPALDKLAQAGSSVDLNKWKGGNALKAEVDTNLGSIQKDLQGTLPPLLSAADKSPASVSAALPVMTNLDALYSVVLRVDISAKANAPRDEAEALDGALAALDGARRDLGDRLTASATAQETQAATLQATVQQQAAQIAAAQAAAAAAPPAVVKPAKKRAVKKKTTDVPAAAPVP